MMFAWAYLDGTGEEVGRSQRFADTEAAEEWMGACWRDLYENGVEEVALHDHMRNRRLYRMGLGAE
ncbi:MAG: hypothetical protein AB1551_00770 [Actinomycetota bacterium]